MVAVSNDEVSMNTKLSAINISEGELLPSFNKDVYSYTVTLPYSTKTVTVIAEPEDESADVNYIPSSTITLEDGLNVVTMIVTQDKYLYEKRYTVDITRTTEPIAYIDYDKNDATLGVAPQQQKHHIGDFVSVAHNVGGGCRNKAGYSVGGAQQLTVQELHTSRGMR